MIKPICTIIDGSDHISKHCSDHGHSILFKFRIESWQCRIFRFPILYHDGEHTVHDLLHGVLYKRYIVTTFVRRRRFELTCCIALSPALVCKFIIYKNYYSGFTALFVHSSLFKRLKTTKTLDSLLFVSKFNFFF